MGDWLFKVLGWFLACGVPAVVIAEVCGKAVYNDRHLVPAHVAVLLLVAAVFTAVCALRRTSTSIAFAAAAAVEVVVGLTYADDSTARWMGAAGIAGWLAPAVWWATRRVLRWRRPSWLRDGSADLLAEGNLWWGMIVNDSDGEVKKRPVLLLGHDGSGLQVVYLTSQDKSGQRGYLHVPQGYAGLKKSGYVNLRDVRVLHVDDLMEYQGFAPDLLKRVLQGRALV